MVKPWIDRRCRRRRLCMTRGLDIRESARLAAARSESFPVADPRSLKPRVGSRRATQRRHALERARCPRLRPSTQRLDRRAKAFLIRSRSRRRSRRGDSIDVSGVGVVHGVVGAFFDVQPAVRGSRGDCPVGAARGVDLHPVVERAKYEVVGKSGWPQTVDERRSGRHDAGGLAAPIRTKPTGAA